MYQRLVHLKRLLLGRDLSLCDFIKPKAFNADTRLHTRQANWCVQTMSCSLYLLLRIDATELLTFFDVVKLT